METSNTSAAGHEVEPGHVPVDSPEKSNSKISLELPATKVDLGPQDRGISRKNNSSILRAWRKFTVFKRRSRIGKLFKQGAPHIEEFLGPVLSGVVVALAMAGYDKYQALLSKTSSYENKFVEEAVSKVKPELLGFGFCLIVLCLFLSGWPLTKWIRRWVLLPFLQFCHHLLLVGAGALFVMLGHALFERASGAVVAQLIFGLYILLLAGAEMQFGCWYAKTNQTDLDKILSVNWQIFLGFVAAAIFYLLT